MSRKKYCIIYREEGDSLSSLFCIVESETVAEDFCKRNSGFYYIVRYTIRGEQSE